MGTDRGGGGGGSTARGALLLAAAVVLGIALLRQFDSGGAPFSQQVDSGPKATTPTTRAETPASILPTPTTRAVRPHDQIKVLAANGTGTAGLGGRTTLLLQALGYNALSAVDATRLFETSQIQYKADFEAEAKALAQLLQLPASSVRVMEDSPPVSDQRDADIIVIIGNDLRLPDSAAGTTTTTRRL